MGAETPFDSLGEAARPLMGRRLTRRIKAAQLAGAETIRRGMGIIRDQTAIPPGVGDPAPDFELPVLGGDAERVRLSWLRGMPVALIFGSYT